MELIKWYTVYCKKFCNHWLVLAKYCVSSDLADVPPNVTLATSLIMETVLYRRTVILWQDSSSTAPHSRNAYVSHLHVLRCFPFCFYDSKFKKKFLVLWAKMESNYQYVLNNTIFLLYCLDTSRIFMPHIACIFRQSFNSFRLITHSSYI